MQKVIFVMGAAATGKTHFINTHYADMDVDILNVYDYQQRAYGEAGGGEDAIPVHAQFRCLMKANHMLLADIMEKVRQGRNVVVEQTFFKEKRRIAYIDEIGKVADVMIEIYVMCPDDERRRRKELLESMNTRLFWHYCEVCGKKEFITAQEAFDSGWDYPPQMGYFGLFGARTCGGCLLKDTLYWRVNTEKKVPLPIVVEGMLTPEELVTWKRIKGEPESLLDAEENGAG